MKARQQKNLRQTADLILEAIDLNEPHELTIDQLIASTGRQRAAVEAAVDLLQVEQRIASYTDRPKRFKRALYTPADIRRAA